MAKPLPVAAARLGRLQKLAELLGDLVEELRGIEREASSLPATAALLAARRFAAALAVLIESEGGAVAGGGGTTSAGDRRSTRRSPRG